jgi:hypothetical protein
MNGNGHNGLAEVEALKWAPLLGEWDIGPDSLVYKGGAEIFQAHGQTFPMGLVVSNRALQHGSYKVAVKFENVAEGSHFAGGLVIGYRSSDRYYIQAQFGACRTAYSVTEFVPGFGWGVLKATGPITALQPNRDYPLEADIRGQEVRVKVDGVSVLEVLLSRPLEGKQIGLIAAGEGKVTFSQVEVTSDRPRLFVAMEYREPFDTFYQKVIKPQQRAISRWSVSTKRQALALSSRTCSVKLPKLTLCSPRSPTRTPMSFTSWGTLTRSESRPFF